MAASLAAVFCLLIGGSYQVLGVPQNHIATVADGSASVVVSVVVGSDDWLLGARPGMPVVTIGAPGQYTVGFPLQTIDVPSSRPSPEPWPWFAAAAVFVIALGMRRWGFPGAALVLTIAASLALWPLLGRAGLPVALPILGLPPLTAAFSLQGWSRGSRWALAGVVLGLGASVLVALALVAVTGWDWWSLWQLPFLIAIAGVVIAATLTTFVETRRWRQEQTGSSLSSDLVAALVPMVHRGRVRGEEHERERLALEVHNEVLPRIHRTMRMLSADAESPAAAELERVESDLRRLMNERQTVVLRIGGLGPALESLLVSAERTTPCRLDVSLEPTDNRYPADVELAAYRIAAEAISNAELHARAHQIVVTVAGDPRQLRVAVADDGDGQEPLVPRLAHVGLAEMRRRADDVDGRLEAIRHADGGSEIRFEWRA